MTPGAGAVMAAAGAFAWWATTLRPFTLPALVAVLSGGVTAMAAGARLLPVGPAPWLRLRRPARWAGLAAAVGLWELASFVQHPRSEHPTVSSLATTVFESHSARAGALLVWLGGAALLPRTTGGRLARPLLLTVWLWLGWHLFVRAGYR